MFYLFLKNFSFRLRVHALKYQKHKNISHTLSCLDQKINDGHLQCESFGKLGQVLRGASLSQATQLRRQFNEQFYGFPFQFHHSKHVWGGGRGVVRFPTEEYKTEFRKKEKTYLNVVKISSLAFENAFVLSRGIRVLGFSTKISLSLSLSLSLAYIIYFYLQTTRGLAPYFSFPREVGRGEETRSFFFLFNFFFFLFGEIISTMQEHWWWWWQARVSGPLFFNK